jgi:hypothetical protein
MKRNIPELADCDRHSAPNISPWPPKFLISDFGLVPEDPDEAAALQAPYETINVEAEMGRASRIGLDLATRAYAELEVRRRAHARNTAAGEAAIRSWSEMSNAPHFPSARDRHALYAAICLGICIGCLVGLYL